MVRGHNRPPSDVGPARKQGEEEVKEEENKDEPVD